MISPLQGLGRLDQYPFPGLHLVVEADQLGNEPCKHGEELEILLKTDLPIEEFVNAEDSHCLILKNNGYSQKCETIFLDAPGAGLVQEQRFFTDIRHHKRFRSREDQARDTLVEPIDTATLFLTGHPMGRKYGQFLAMSPFQSDGGPLHGEFAGKDLEYLEKCLTQVQRMAHDFAHVRQYLEFQLSNCCFHLINR